ncbi:hypothetical protein OS493_013287 [Desmophyllum pertusum]|uniref:Uncharacterized protein n=1 Tax=Desmophyllum pertusum TaxID=174260 RepID=A0A9W9YQA3_9CNID|nr:hypothetical protein OS493_013287 [Desmophyllum pertusum]
MAQQSRMLDGWLHGIDGIRDLQSALLNSGGCGMDGLIKQTVVTMCRLDGSTVAAVGWMASWNRRRRCRMDGLMEQTVVTKCSMDGSTVKAVGWMAHVIQAVVAMCSLDGSKVAAVGWMVSWNSDNCHDVQSGWLNSRGCRMDSLMEFRQLSRCAVRTARQSRLEN